MPRISSAQRAIERFEDLPAMPEIVSEVLCLTENPQVSMAEVSGVVERDPALTAKILRVSNSSYYGMKQYVGTLKLALVILGVREIRNIVLGISVFETLRSKENEALFAHGFWEHSLRAAGLAKKLGQHLGLGLQGEDFIAGLLHDLGKMVMWRSLGQDYADMYRANTKGPDALQRAELDVFDFDHADVAHALAVKWNLPKTLADAVLYHHPAQEKALRDAKDPQLAAVIRLANRAAHDAAVKDDKAACSACEDQEAWDELEGAPGAICASQRAQILAHFAAELQEQPPRIFDTE